MLPGAYRAASAFSTSINYRFSARATNSVASPFHTRPTRSVATFGPHPQIPKITMILLQELRFDASFARTLMVLVLSAIA
jgi:hypothetical protein